MEWSVQRRVLHGAYRTKESIPEEIHHLTVAYEGIIPNCTGWNMPSAFVEKHVSPTSPLRAYLSQVEYMIIYPKTDLQTKKHELLHALYGMDSSYRRQIYTLWNSLSDQEQQRVRQTLLGLGYPDRQDLLLDEFQAYYHTEKGGFFGTSVARNGIGTSVARNGIGTSVARNGIGTSVARNEGRGKRRKGK
jgi:hypothetical protein